MDTKKHLEVALAAHDKWLHDESDSRYWPEIAVTALDSDGLLCTEVEREFIEAWFAKGPTIDAPGWARLQVARDAILAERAGEPVEPASAPEPAAERADISRQTLIGAAPLVHEAGLLRLRTPDEDAALPFKPHPQRCEQELAEANAEIATLKERLAEATKPRKVWHEVEQRDDRVWVVWRVSEDRRSDGYTRKERVCGFEISAHPNAEQHARAHAAKLDAEQGGGV